MIKKLLILAQKTFDFQNNLSDYLSEVAVESIFKTGGT